MPKFLYYPITPFVVNQPFGVNPATYAQFGLKGHNGIDLRAFHGQPVYAAHDGTAYFESDANQGEGVVVISNQTCNYDVDACVFTFNLQKPEVFWKSVYWHFCDELKDPKFVSPVLKYQRANNGAGMEVKAGDLLGYADNTGFSTGDHLHFALKPIKKGNPNPQDATDDTPGQWVNVSPNNGFLGGIDPAPYLTATPAQNVPELVITEKKLIPLLQQLVELLLSKFSKLK